MDVMDMLTGKAKHHKTDGGVGTATVTPTFLTRESISGFIGDHTVAIQFIHTCQEHSGSLAE